MSEWIYSVVLIVPAAYRDAADALGEAMGWGPDSYTVPLSATGAAPASHFGCRPVATQDFVDLLANPTEEALAAGAGTILSALISDIQTNVDGAAHFAEVIAANGLQIVTTE